MKNSIMFIGLLFFKFIAKSQGIPAEQLSQKLSQRMKDSLSLSETQREQLYTINMNLHQQKFALRSQYKNIDSLTRAIQVVENSRDSLYRPVLSAEQYQQYRLRKRNLLNNN